MARGLEFHLSMPQLEYLVAAVDHETWADAAAAVGVSSSALSQGLAELQRRLGVPVFERDGRRMALRPGAEPVVAHARRMLAEARDVARWAERTRLGTEGRVAVGMIDAAAIHYYGDTLARFRAERPELDHHLVVAPTARLIESLRSGELDLAVGVDRDELTGDDTIETSPLIDEDLWVYAPTGQGDRRPDAWGPWVTFPNDSHSRRVIAAALRSHGAPFDVVAESSQPDVLREMVRLGVGWAVLPRREAERDPHPLVPARRRPVATRVLTLMQRADRAPGPAAADLVERLIAATPA